MCRIIIHFEKPNYHTLIKYILYLDKGVLFRGDLPSCEGGVMWGNFAGDGSRDGVSTEKIFSSTSFNPLDFLGVVPFATSMSYEG